MNSFQKPQTYKDIWSLAAGEELPCEREGNNTQDSYAAAVTRESAIIGHMARKLSDAWTLLLQMQGTIICMMTGMRHFSDDLPQG